MAVSGAAFRVLLVHRQRYLPTATCGGGYNGGMRNAVSNDHDSSHDGTCTDGQHCDHSEAQELLSAQCGATKHDPDSVARVSGATATTTAAAVTPRRVVALLLVMAVLSFVQNGVLGSIATYVFLPFGGGKKVRSSVCGCCCCPSARAVVVVVRVSRCRRVLPLWECPCHDSCLCGACVCVRLVRSCCCGQASPARQWSRSCRCCHSCRASTCSSCGRCAASPASHSSCSPSCSLSLPSYRTAMHCGRCVRLHARFLPSPTPAPAPFPAPVPALAPANVRSCFRLVPR
jgi:hypothetical protein